MHTIIIIIIKRRLLSMFETSGFGRFFPLLCFQAQMELGELQLTMGYQKSLRQLTVVIRHGKDLPKMDEAGSAGELCLRKLLRPYFL